MERFYMRVGMLVRVIEDCAKKGRTGPGRIVKFEKAWIARTPVIRVGRRLIRGCECWWISERKAQKAERIASAANGRRRG